MKTIGESMRRAREEAGMTMVDLAKEAGIHTQGVARHERGNTYPGLLNLISLADTLGISIDEYIGRVEQDGAGSHGYRGERRKMKNMTFGEAIEAVKKGKRIAREGWNGKGQYVFLADDVGFYTDADISDLSGRADGVYVHAMLVIRTACGDLQPGWLASQADMLESDWMIVVK